MTRLFRITAALVLMLALGCSESANNRPARIEYNKALKLYADQKWDAAAKAFLDARDKSGPDPELRYRAAFNLALTRAKQADAITEKDPEKAMARLQDAADWFFDALHKKPGDHDAKKNLELVLERIEVLADKINKGKNTLLNKLKLLVQNQRALLQEVRELMSHVAAQKAKADPVAFEDQFRQLAVRERELMADATSVSDLAGAERGNLENKPKNKRKDSDKARIFQLKNVDKYMEQARSAMAETRRLLRRLQGDSGHKRADAALTALKRARDKLLLPDAILRGILADLSVLLQHTQALLAVNKKLIKTKDGKPAQAPPWLTTPLLATRQQVLTSRLDEVFNYMLAIASADLSKKNGAGKDPKQLPPAQKATPPKPKDPKQAQQEEMRKRFVANTQDAVGYVQTAMTKMRAAKTDLDGGAEQLDKAVEAQAGAAEALGRALEQYAALRQLIELAYADQGKMVAVLSPPPDAKKVHNRNEAMLAQLSPAQRGELTRTLLEYNTDRLKRLEPMLARALKKAQAQATAAPASKPAGPKALPNPKDPRAAAAKKARAEVQRYTQAQLLRGEAAEALAKLTTQLGGNKKPDKANPVDTNKLLPDAKIAHDKLAELRKLFFNLIQHLRELIRVQSDTLDTTVRAQQATGKERVAQLGPLPDTQAKHAQVSQAISKALGEQADQLNKQNGKSLDKKQRDYAKKVSEAAAEVTSATGKMNDATTNLEEARDKSATTTYDLKPTLADQRKALTHLSRALELLQPPKNPKQKNNKKQNKKQQDMSRQQAQSRLQRARDREAQRKRAQHGGKREPVEKDW